MTTAYSRLRLRVPERCKFCLTAGRVKPEQTITGSTVVLKWCCDACHQDWPVTEDEQIAERRQGLPDRRRTTRKDRRD